jgi:Asp/Glu/hydantoin racemase
VALDAAERLAMLEERVSVLREDVRALERDVAELARFRVAAEAIARQATEKAVRESRSREVLLLGAGLALTAVNVVVSVWT